MVLLVCANLAAAKQLRQDQASLQERSSAIFGGRSLIRYASHVCYPGFEGRPAKNLIRFEKSGMFTGKNTTFLQQLQRKSLKNGQGEWPQVLPPSRADRTNESEDVLCTVISEREVGTHTFARQADANTPSSFLGPKEFGRCFSHISGCAV